MGPALDKLEKIVITEPTAVRVPQNWWHGPLKFVRVGKPVLFQAALFSGRPGYIKKVKTSDGELLEFIEGEAHRKPHTGERASVAWSAANEDGVARYTDDGAYDAAKAPDWENCARVPGYIPISYSDATTLLHEKPALSRAVAKSVLAMPKEVTCRPLFTISSQSQALSCSPDSRESRPTATLRSSFPRRPRSQRAKPRPMSRQACSVRLTGWPAIPSSATPRMSLPFCKLE